MNQQALIEIIKESIDDSNDALYLGFKEIAQIYLDYALKLIPFIIQEEIAQELITKAKEIENTIK